ncbi:GPI mannosyltransferase 2 [Cinara cedri]|uniref:GPI mannosyltransferase 2 n=1 Tax=Cinara cedri TaxID=506608 RepID=A0A5E4NHW3_9HEMI|nr:GPI mannosyltransferase 2 [Cinara cedri]
MSKTVRLDATSCRNAVWRMAAYSRLAVLVVQYLSNALISDHQARDVFISPCLGDGDDTVVGRVVTHFLGGFLRWDAQYFLHVYRYGYTYENALAFFPAFPGAVRLLAAIVPGHPNTAFLAVSIALNNVVFVFAALALYDLTLRVHDNDVRTAYNSAVLFCFNPASVFFSAPYSESLFALTTFYGMYHVQRDSVWKSALCFGCCALNRSNGLLNSGYLLYSAVRTAVTKRILLFKFVLGSCLVFACFGSFQLYGYYKFCTLRGHYFEPKIVDYARANNLVMPNNHTVPLWCGVRLPYSYVQEKYWQNIGFLNYYQFKQIPNFMLAFPCIFLLLNHGFKYFYNNNIMYLGLRDRDKPDFVYVVHSTVLTLFCLFCIHVQVTTRMLASSSPVFYWACGSYFQFPLNFNRITYRRVYNDFKSRLVVLYFLAYFVVGTALFVNFLPFT